MDDLLSIGEVAQRFSLTPRALRFYESKGLVRPKRVGSSSAPRRLYRPADLERLKEIIKMIDAGFTLREVQVVIAIKDHVQRCRKIVEVGLVVRERLSENQKTLITQARSLERLIRWQP